MTTPTTTALREQDQARAERHEHARNDLARDLQEQARTMNAIADDLLAGSYDPWPLYDDLDETASAIRQALDEAVETGIAEGPDA